MRCLESNKSDLWYSNYLGETANTENGYETGEKTISYSEPVHVRANVSPPSGRVFVDKFGNSIDYDKVVVTDDVDIPITESSIFFIDVTPAQNTYGDWNYDYVVKKIAPSINSVTIALSRRDVS